MTGSPVRLRGRRLAGASKRALLERAARSYLAGPGLADAVAAAEALVERGFGVTLAYWNPIGEPAGQVAQTYLAAVHAAGRLSARESAGVGTGVGSVDVAVKVPALDVNAGLVDAIAAASAQAGTRLWFDSHGAEVADATLEIAANAAAAGTRVGVAMPARWRRSVADAERIGPALDVRLVKGQWADPLGPCPDVGAWYLDLVDRLAGRARLVGIATHDSTVLAGALARLQAAGTPAEVQLLSGLPSRRALRVATAADTPVRVYVPFGAAYLMYSPRSIWENRRIAVWLARDVVTGTGQRRLRRLPVVGVGASG
jgi:proline dehydrogenase